MNYSIYEIIFFLFVYAFLGWVMEVVMTSFRTGRFCNRGFLNMPLCMAYGLVMSILILMMPTLSGRYVLQFIACVVVASAGANLSGAFAAHEVGQRLWKYEETTIFSGEAKGLLYTLALGSAAMTTVLLIHPVLFVLCQMIPKGVLHVLDYLLLVILLLDFASIEYAMHKRKLGRGLDVITRDMQERKNGLGYSIYHHIWVRLKKAYPDLETHKDGFAVERGEYVFAKGICLDKLIWIFLITALIGDIIETFYVHAVSHIWMSRSSLIYGTFSVVWGAGAVLLTVVLQRLAGKEDRYIFLGGFFLGGTYEYMCSVFTEVFFHTTFWDYSKMPFNIGGRTNLLFCVFWGALSLVWVKLCYPPVSSLIEKIPPLPGKIVTWTVVVLLVCDMIISGLAMSRYVERGKSIPASNAIESFLDDQYPDHMIEWVWPNMRVKKSA